MTTLALLAAAALFATRAAFRRRSTGAALALRRTHLLELLHLLRCQNLLHLRFHVGFQISDLPLLVVGEFQFLVRASRQQM